MEELLKSIGITDKGEYSKTGSYVLDIPTYDDYSKYYSLLEKSDFNEVQDTAQITFHTTNVTYDAGEYQIVLQADLDEDIYKLVVTKF